MSRVEMPGICYCECHKPGVTMMHNVACCVGRCPVCLKRHTTERHAEECAARREKAVDDLVNE